MDTERKITLLKQKLENPYTPNKEHFEILGLFMSFYTNQDFNIIDFYKELDRLAK